MAFSTGTQQGKAQREPESDLAVPVGWIDEMRFSADSDIGRSQVLIFRAIRVLAWLLLTLIVVLSLAPPAFRPQTSVSHTIEHAGIFLATGTAFGISYGRRGALLYVAAILFCAALEIAQAFDPGRHARMSDFLVDFISMWLGLLAGSLLGRSLPFDAGPTAPTA